MPRQEQNDRLAVVSKPVWDLATRIFHWLLVALLAICYISADQGRFDVHIPAGQALLVLITARIVWGFCGSDSSRFRKFLNIQSIPAYLKTLFRRSPDRHPGHNPLGGLWIVTFLVLLLVHIGLGLFATDIDLLNEGPLSYLVSFEAAREAAELHDLMMNILILMIVIHLLAILFHQFYKRENLTKSMITGTSMLHADTAAPEMVPVRRALIVLLASTVGVLGTIEVITAVF